MPERAAETSAAVRLAFFRGTPAASSSSALTGTAALVSLTRRRLTSRLGLGHLLLARLAGRHWRHENVTGRAPAADHLPVDVQEQPASRRAAQHCAPEDIVVYARVAWRNLLPVKRIAIAHVRPAKLVLLADSPFDARDRCRAVGACHALILEAF